jgi:uncharacterized protein
MLQTLLLLLILAALAWWAYLDTDAYRAFRLVEDSAKRRAFYRQWTWIPFVALGLGGLALLGLTGSLDALWRMPPEFAALRPTFEAGKSANANNANFLVGVMIGLICAGLVLGIALGIWARRIRKLTMPVVGDIEPLLPRNGAEIACAIPMAINAGVTEELFFRLALPLLAAQVTGSGLAGFAIACAAFALVHWYQGWKGMLVVFAFGIFFAGLYLLSGSLLLPMLVHVLVDLIALVVRPAIALRLRRRAAAA